eukprot:3393191-Prymnesium_polylepis.1
MQRTQPDPLIVQASRRLTAAASSARVSSRAIHSSTSASAGASPSAPPPASARARYTSASGAWSFQRRSAATAS